MGATTSSYVSLRGISLCSCMSVSLKPDSLDDSMISIRVSSMQVSRSRQNIGTYPA